jgi:hypothetical protein
MEILEIGIWRRELVGFMVFFYCEEGEGEGGRWKEFIGWKIF